jgi:hypothetical protein
MSDHGLFDEIAQVAYELWEKNGCIHGRDIEYWCEAESIIVTRLQPIEGEKPKKAKAPRKAAAKPTTKARKPAGPAKKS